MIYEIQTEAGTVLASDLNDDAVDAWWKVNENKYFGLRVVNQNIIVVCEIHD